MVPRLHIVRTPDGNGLPLPSYSSRYHVGLNLVAAIRAPIKINPGERLHVPIGFAIGIPVGFCGQIVSRQVLALEHGIIVSDAPHLVNPADRGPLFVLLQNMSKHQYVVRRGDPIAQLVIMPAVQVCWNEISVSMDENKTNDKDIILDAEEEAKKEEKSTQGIQRRVKKSIRDRYKKDEDNE